MRSPYPDWFIQSEYRDLVKRYPELDEVEIQIKLELWLDEEESLYEPVNYNLYINGPYWQDKSKKTKHARGGQCEECGGPADATHHLNYLHLGWEWPTDLRVVCNRCHRDLHEVNEQWIK